MSEDDVAEMLRLYEERPRRRTTSSTSRSSRSGSSSIADRIDASTRAVFARAPLARRARIKLRHALTAGARREAESARLHEFCLVGWYSMTVNANGDAVTCCILQDHKTAVLGSVHSSGLRGDLERTGLRALPRASCARSWPAAAPSGPATSRARCVVEPLCAQKDACPNRSYYWAGDLAFRREFHRTVEALPPAEGAAFVAPDGRNPAAAGRRHAGAPGALAVSSRPADGPRTGLPPHRNGHQPAGRFFERSL